MAKNKDFSPRNPVAFPKLTAAQIKDLSKFAACKTFKAKEKLFSAGDTGMKFFIIKSGEVAIIDPVKGFAQPVTIHTAGDFTGDVDILTGRAAVVTAVALTDCKTYEIAPEDIRRIISEMPQISDILLKAFLMRRRLLIKSGAEGVRVLGSRYSRDTHRIREFLAKNRVMFSWIDLENDPQVDKLLEQFRMTPEQTPVVICSTGKMQCNPSNEQLADCLGIRKPLEHTIYDLVIIGAGPAGLAAAVYGASEGLQTLILDKIGPGGQASNSSKIENYMGFPTGLSGSDLAHRAVIQALKFGATISAASEVVRLSYENGYHTVHVQSNEEVSAKCVLIATGAAYRKLDLKDCEQFEGCGIYYAATTVEADMCRDAPIIIVGDGNSAGQAAVYLSERARQVYMLILGDKLGEHMSRYLVRRIEHTPNIKVLPHTQITKMYGDTSLSAVDLTNSTGQTSTVDCLAVFVFIGATPHTHWLQGMVELDRNGYIKTGLLVADSPSWSEQRQPFLLETNRPGIFAAGDARLDSIKRVASAVGEGAMGVLFVHQYLASL